jgi:hypothetical protein
VPKEKKKETTTNKIILQNGREKGTIVFNVQQNRVVFLSVKMHFFSSRWDNGLDLVILSIPRQGYCV